MKTLVAIIHHPTFGGPHNQLLRLSGPLLECGWDTVVVLPDSPGNAADRLRDAGLRVLQVPLHKPRKSLHPGVHLKLLTGIFPEISNLRRIIRRERADVVQLFGPIYPHGAIAGRLERVPVVWQLLGTFAPLPIRTVMMPAVLRLSDVVMTTGLGTAKAHPGALRLGNRLVPFFPPVNTSEFRPDPERRLAAREKLGVSPDAVLIGTVGNFNQVKGHDMLVRAAAQVLQHFPNAAFRILGAATPGQIAYYEENVKTPAANLGLLKNGSLRFMDPGNRVSEFLPAFDIFVLSSRAEGVPTAALEAMSCRIPVIATDVGSVREVIEDHVTGRVVGHPFVQGLTDAMLDLLRSPELRFEMGTIARQRATDRYDVIKCVDTHLHAYEMAQAVRNESSHPERSEASHRFSETQ